MSCECCDDPFYAMGGEVIVAGLIPAATQMFVDGTGIYVGCVCWYVCCSWFLFFKKTLVLDQDCMWWFLNLFNLLTTGNKIMFGVISLECDILTYWKLLVIMKPGVSFNTGCCDLWYQYIIVTNNLLCCDYIDLCECKGYLKTSQQRVFVMKCMNDLIILTIEYECNFMCLCVRI